MKSIKNNWAVFVIIGIGILGLAAIYYGNAQAQAVKYDANGYPLFFPHTTIVAEQLNRLVDKDFGNRTGINRLRATKKDSSVFNGYSARLAARFGAAGSAGSPGIATLNSSSLVVQNPAIAKGSPTPASIPISDANGWLDGWINAIADTIINFSDNTTGNANAAMHGYMPKTPGGTGKYLVTGLGNYSSYVPGVGMNGGTVTSVNGTDANGFAWSISDPTVDPYLTLKTTPHGMLFSNGTGMSVAVSGTNYQAPITYVENVLSADVTMTNANTYYDGPSISLTAGTWLITSNVTGYTTNANVTAKLWDGSTVLASGELPCVTYANPVTISLSRGVVVASPTTYKVSVSSPASGGKIKAATVHNGAGNNASIITAYKIGP